MRLKADEIVHRLRHGWELGYGNGSRGPGSFWIQKGGLCKGGESINVHAATAFKLIKAGMVRYAPKPGDKFWLKRYALKP